LDFVAKTSQVAAEQVQKFWFVVNDQQHSVRSRINERRVEYRPG
jgi:hypothetical protein